MALDWPAPALASLWWDTAWNFAVKWQASLIALAACSIALTSAAISIAAFVRSGRKDFRGLLRDRIFEKIAKLREDAEEISVQVQQNLTGETAPLTLAESHRKISVSVKQLEIRVAELRTCLPCKKAEIFEAYTAWKNVLMGEGYPVLKKTAVFKVGESRLANNHVAQTVFVVFLSEIEDGCIREKFAFWEG